jgi:hypothetical protein
LSAFLTFHTLQQIKPLAWSPYQLHLEVRSQFWIKDFKLPGFFFEERNFLAKNSYGNKSDF